MVVFHFCFDLNYFGYADFDIYHGAFWKNFRVVIVSLFLVIMGASLVFAYQGGINPVKFRKRLLLLGGAAALITVATYFVFPKSWIYFGILHFVFVATLVGVLFVRAPWLSLILGFLILAGTHEGHLSTSFIYTFLQPHLGLPRYTEDIVRFFPWFGVVLIGIFLGHRAFLGLKLPDSTVTQKIALLGRHSLLIYLVHQPLLFGPMMLVHRFS
jgi:uncharacterized membrane protein